MVLDEGLCEVLSVARGMQAEILGAGHARIIRCCQCAIASC